MSKFFSFVHAHFIKKQRELEPSQQPIELKKLSDTRWSCQHYSLWAVKKQQLPAITATLNDIKLQPNSRRSLLTLIDAEFILQLILFEDLFLTAKFMSDTLQSPDLLLETATDLAQSVITSVKERRTRTLGDPCGARQRPCARRWVSPYNHRHPHKRKDNPNSLAIHRTL